MNIAEAFIAQVLEQHRIREPRRDAGGSYSAMSCTCGAHLDWFPAPGDRLEVIWRQHAAQEIVRAITNRLLYAKAADA